MKKILVCLIGIMFVLPFGAVAHGVCGSNQQSYQGNQKVDDDEFLYNSKVARDNARKKDDNGNEQCKKSCYLGDGERDLSKKVFECDKEQGCGRGTYILTNKNFYWDGKPTGEVAMFCEMSGFNDRWMKIKIKDCDELFNVYPKINRSTEYIKNFTGKECYETTYGVCCYGVNEGQDIETPDVKPTCKEQRDTPEGIACCDLSDNVATYDKENDKCICIGDYEFAIENGRGVCNPKAGGDDDSASSCPNGGREEITSQESCVGQGTFHCVDPSDDGAGCLCGICIENNREPEETYECKPAFLVKIDLWAKECKDEMKYAEILALISRIKDYCSDDLRTEEGFLNLSRELEALNPEVCAVDTYNMISQATQKINVAVDSLRSYVSDLDVSKWKTADGKFNTARLASDSIAGVVLGTAGGLITSNVVKKHQVEDGFEDLQCVIGGQTVAGWGDEFTVGVH